MSKVAVVTGANQGLGLSLVESLLENLDEGSIVYLTARSTIRGEAAIAALEQKGLKPCFHQLDICDIDSINRFAEFMKTNHGGIDIFISNAGARIDKEIPQSEQVKAFINTNNHGSYDVLKAFIPIMNDNGRYFIVSSGFGTLKKLDSSLHHKFNVETASLEDIEEIMDEYIAAIEDGTAKSLGWPEWINIPSKIGQVATAKIMARDLAAKNPEKGIKVTAVCPGLIRTEASRPWFSEESFAKAPTPLEASKHIVRLCTTAEDYAVGSLIQYGEVIEWK
eukprot:TRINITY_DN776134_c0_g1_i1.p1 TRINITY_DN776134_c0_g1~~TRINITY_DN776134_c0_g1_i1.p1  ORF type:complete len:279 (+),score=83.99 TRINITY_DN776134_c0_g1_i1:347-1183(+)